ncbi:MAG: hypothetical protein COT81_05170 [Candidatus Buchananbacteria bacterium CG10_big_fil_rev_8_21_14_0_10_42_9]|uniref:DUF1573 domain-containing protein n=1 Tax=Candidatus Buchananbacteria bacterium CG10_big_fil_rev_8_21_14_0_10_42_9 TaxID=1974526 RepID=A0A2H0W008_9BACT|nr:MAG: hypothetical protein COT81_05170 [Candidatus Buchananbacteria bacterium CG10_big_fil_rev_8_21_14_0_10_42_9]
MKHKIIITLTLVVLLNGCALAITKEKPNIAAPAQDSVFEFDEQEYDFGVVKQSGGIVAHDFSFTYNGADPIKVTGVPASCACTSAEIDKSELSPGDSGVITVAFDPNLHEEPQGRFFKTVAILTEPKLEIEPEIKIWAEINLDLGPEAYKLKEHID